VALEILPSEIAVPVDAPMMSVPMRHPDGEGRYEVWHQDGALILRVAPIATFACTPDRLEFQRAPGATEEALQWQTFGLVLSAWSEWAGRPVLHAATVEVGSSAVGFLGRSGVGKSSLTLEFLRHGHRVCGDDHLILEPTPARIQVLPAIPWLKLGFDLAKRSGLDPATMPRVHSGSEKRRLDVRAGEWVDGPLPLGPIYLVERGWQKPEVVIEKVAPGESVLELVRHTYVPRTVAASGVAGSRLPVLTAAVQQGGVWRLRYPDGVEWLPKVREAVVQHEAERAIESRARSRR
jgi:hypothetical protein